MFLTPLSLIEGYKQGIFPMAESKDDSNIFWVSPEIRGIINLKYFIIPKSLKKIIKKGNFKIRINHDFFNIINCCAEINYKRKNTWINKIIIDSYTELHKLKLATSVECYYEEKLVGGLYGVHLGKFFFGESMFSRKSNASKIALVYLAAHLKKGGFETLDTQYFTRHLKQFGAIQIRQEEYLKLLKKNTARNLAFPEKLSMDVLDYFI